MTRADLAAALAAELWRLHNDENLSWRDIQRDYYPTVNWATLNRIALSKGGWLPSHKTPQGRKILKALGLIESKSHEWLPGEWQMKRRIGKAAQETEKEVLRNK